MSPNNSTTVSAEFRPFSFTRLTVADGGGSATKRLIPDDKGLPVKDPKHLQSIWRATAEVITVAGLAGLRDWLADADSNDAIVHGVFDSDGEVAIVAESKLSTTPGAIARTKAFFSWPSDVWLGVLDIDKHPHFDTTDMKRILATLTEALPELAGIGFLITASTSSSIKRGKTWLDKTDKWHVYFLATGDPETLKELLEERLWIAETGWVLETKADAKYGVSRALPRCLVDLTVFSPERIDYIAPAEIAPDADFFQQRPKPKLIPGDVLDVAALPARTGDAKPMIEAAKSEARNEIRASVIKRVKAERPKIDDKHAELVADVFLKRAERGDLEADVMVELDSGQTIAAGDLNDAHDGATMPDPDEGIGYGRGRAKFFWNDGRNPQIHSMAHGLSRTYRIRPAPTSDHMRWALEVAEMDLDAASVEGLLQAQKAETKLSIKVLRENQKNAAEQARQWELEINGDGVDDAVIAKLNKKFSVVTQGSKVRIMELSYDPALKRHGYHLMQQADFRLRHANKFVKVATPSGEKEICQADYWVRHEQRQEYDGIVFMPEGAPSNYFNAWHGLAIQSVEGDCSLLLAHMKEVLCAGSQSKFDYLLRWCAHLVQRPAELPGTAVVLRSGQGTGKNAFVGVFRRILGRHYLEVASPQLVYGRFNHHMLDALLVFANESVWNDQRTGRGALFARITDPIDTIEGKGENAFSIANYKRFIASSNKDWVVPRDMDDRRFFCLDVSDARKGDSAYFKALFAECRSDAGIAAFLHVLLSLDISDWTPWDSLPKDNADGEDMKLSGASSSVQFLHHCLDIGENQRFHDMGDPWSTRLSKKAFYQSYLDWFAQQRRRDAANISAIFWKKIREIIVVKDDRPRTDDPVRGRHVVFPELTQARTQFQKHINVPFGGD